MKDNRKIFYVLLCTARRERDPEDRIDASLVGS